MIKPIMTKSFFLKQPSVEANMSDIELARDLVDTLEAHRHECVGMAIQHEIDHCNGMLI